MEPQAIQAPAKSEPTQVQLVYGYRTDTGRGRNNNEDSLLAIHLVGLCELQCSPTLGFFAVADGVGGYAGGEVASHSIVRSLGQSILQNIFISELNAPSLLKEGLADQLRMAVLGANQAVIEAHQTSSSETEMESTLTAALVRERTAVIANVGDSRTYIMRQGHLTQLTKDHSVVARLVEQGTLSPKEIYTHEQRNIIFRTLGENPDVEVDIFTIELEPGDRLLLCSDGLWEMVHDPYIEDVLLECSDPQQACDKLVDMANLAGGDDNISLIVINLQV